MTKYEMVAKLEMVLNGNYNSADVQSVIDALNEEINKDKNKSLNPHGNWRVRGRGAREPAAQGPQM